MTKMGLIKIVSEDTNLTKADASRFLNAMMNAIIDAVANGDKVTLVGFGTFTVTERKAKEGHNPRTSETIRIPASKVPKFVAGKGFREAVK